MVVPVRALLGLGAIPKHRASAVAWLRREGCNVVRVQGNGGQRDAVDPSMLPEFERRAWLDRTAEEQGLEPGTYDEAAHAALLEATPAVRDRADKKAAIVRFLVARRKAGMTRAEAHAAVRDTFGEEFTSAASLDRMEARVAGVDPVNYAPALMDGYCRDGAPRVDIPTEAWTLFEGIVKGAFHTHRMTANYNDVARLAKKKGQCWPSFSTVMRRFKELPVAEQWALRFGTDEARKRLEQPRLLDSTGLRAMEWVSQDSRKVDVFVEMPDGRVIRPVGHGLTDQASGKVFGPEWDETENSQATARLQHEVFGLYGAPENLKTDNSSTFAGHAQAGQVAFKFRNRGNRRRDLEPPGVFKLLGFKLHFASVKNGKAKRVERTFADLSREIDTCPEFRGAHAGSKPGERPSGDIVPVKWEFFKKVYAERVAAYNARKGRRSQGCRATGTSSYNDAFAAKMAVQQRRSITETQLRYVTMEWTLSTVKPDGRVPGKDGWVYGENMDDGSQDKLLRFTRKKVWVGTDPLDRGKPALVWDPATDEIIQDGVHAVIRGAFADQEGSRRSARSKASVRKLTKRIDKLNADAAIAELSGLYADLVDPDLPEPSVVAPNFKQPIRRASGGDAKGDVTDLPKRQGGVPEEYLRNMKAAQAKRAQER